jgi:hypothetical protein
MKSYFATTLKVARPENGTQGEAHRAREPPQHGVLVHDPCRPARRACRASAHRAEGADVVTRWRKRRRNNDL